MKKVMLGMGNRGEKNSWNLHSNEDEGEDRLTQVNILLCLKY